MNDERINHYYPAGVIAWGFSKNKIKPLRRSKVNVINIPNLITLLNGFESQGKNLEDFINTNITFFLYEKTAEDIFTSRNLTEKNDNNIQEIEQSILKLLKNGWPEEKYKIETKEQETKEDRILLDFIKLSINRSVLFTDDFLQENIVSELEGLEKFEWIILESEDDCAVISDLNPILVFSLNNEVINFFKCDPSIKDKIIYFVPILSNKWLVISNNKAVINSFYENCQDKDFKTNILSFLFVQALMFSLQYIVVGKNNWIIDLVINLISDSEFRKEFIKKRKYTYKVTKYFNTIHNLKK